MDDVLFMSCPSNKTVFRWRVCSLHDLQVKSVYLTLTRLKCISDQYALSDD